MRRYTSTKSLESKAVSLTYDIIDHLFCDTIKDKVKEYKKRKEEIIKDKSYWNVLIKSYLGPESL